MLHQTESMGSMSGMQDVRSINVAAGGTLKFAPGGYHLMCMNTTKAIQPGKTVPVTLDFADGTKIVSTFSVRTAMGK